jgi:hypothetical protein
MTNATNLCKRHKVESLSDLYGARSLWNEESATDQKDFPCFVSGEPYQDDSFSWERARGIRTEKLDLSK